MFKMTIVSASTPTGICESRLLGLSSTPTAEVFIEYLQFLQNELPHLSEDTLLKIQLFLFLQLEDFPHYHHALETCLDHRLPR